MIKEWKMRAKRMRKNVSAGQRIGELFARHNERIRIAVVGAQECGKTMFLVSLINHLLQADFGDFGKVEKWEVSSGAEILSPRPPKGMEPFDYDRYHKIFDALFGYKDGKPSDKGSVPPSTLQTYLLQMMVPLGRTEATSGVVKSKKVLLEVLDVPGERVADFAMFNRSYEDWCRELTRARQGVAGGTSSFDRYMEKVSRASNVDEIKDAFFEFVLDRHVHNSTLIYPSSILLTLSGEKTSRQADTSELKRESIPFFQGDGFFAPLPEAFFHDKTKKGIVKAFSKAYKQYCIDSGLNEVCGWLETANKVYYLLDVFSILMSGKEREDDMRSHIRETLKVFGRREGNIISRAYNGFVDFLMRSRASEIYLVGTQIDRASKSQRNNIKKLLDNEFGSILKMPELEGKFCDIKTCAAICFGQSDGDDLEMSYKRSAHDETIYEAKKVANEVPTKFPENYSYIEDENDERQKKYAYPYSQPRFCGREEKVYDHVHFDQIVETIFTTHSEVKGDGNG